MLWETKIIFSKKSLRVIILIILIIKFCLCKQKSKSHIRCFTIQILYWDERIAFGTNKIDKKLLGFTEEFINQKPFVVVVTFNSEPH